MGSPWWELLMALGVFVLFVVIEALEMPKRPPGTHPGGNHHSWLDRFFEWTDVNGPDWKR